MLSRLDNLPSDFFATAPPTDVSELTGLNDIGRTTAYKYIGLLEG